MTNPQSKIEVWLHQRRKQMNWNRFALLWSCVFILFPYQKTHEKKNLFFDFRWFIEIFGWKLVQKFEIQSIDLAHCDRIFRVAMESHTLRLPKNVFFYNSIHEIEREQRNFTIFFSWIFAKLIDSFFDSRFFIFASAKLTHNW